MDCVAEQTPWWHEGPWIWQIDAEQQGLPRPPSPDEIRWAVDAVHDRMARERTTGYVVVYAPRWLYGDELGTGYDLWNSDYTGSGARSSDSAAGIPTRRIARSQGIEGFTRIAQSMSALLGKVFD
jgi:hypothetical protein